MPFPENSGGDSARRYQPVDGQQWQFPEMQPVPQPQPAPRKRTGLQTGGWITVIVATLALIAVVVWLGLNASQVPTATVEEREALERVQTPKDAPPAAEGESNVLVPAFAPWAPGTKIQSTDHYPSPGEHFTAQSCTSAFSFTGANGRAYAVTAGHCGRTGDLVWPTNAATAYDYTREVGKFIYSGMYGDADEATEGIDIGIVEITDRERTMDVIGKPIPTGIANHPHDLERVCKTGATTGYTCGEFVATQRVQIVNLDGDAEAQTEGDIASVCAASGDSGGPVFTEINGRATVVGVVSGTEAGRAGEECFEGMDDPLLMSYSNIEQVMTVINRVVPDADLVPQHW